MDKAVSAPPAPTAGNPSALKTASYATLTTAGAAARFQLSHYISHRRATDYDR